VAVKTKKKENYFRRRDQTVQDFTQRRGVL
jgi:hypothetical protein